MSKTPDYDNKPFMLRKEGERVDSRVRQAVSCRPPVAYETVWQVKICHNAPSWESVSATSSQKSWPSLVHPPGSNVQPQRSIDYGPLSN